MEPLQNLKSFCAILPPESAFRMLIKQALEHAREDAAKSASETTPVAGKKSDKLQGLRLKIFGTHATTGAL